MRYLCVHCEHRFEAEGVEPPRRCPACMRAAGVQPVRDEPATKATPKRARLALLGVFALALLAGVVGYFLLGKRSTAGEQGLAGPLSEAQLHGVLGSLNVDAGELLPLLIADPAVQRFAETATASAATPFEKAQAITAALRLRASKLSFVPWSLGEPRTTVIGTARQTLSVLAKDNARAELYPLELSSLAVAALRAVDVPALVAELISVDKDERAPLDPSGYLGYFVVAVYPGEPGVGAPQLFDPYGGRALGSLGQQAGKYAVLSDTRAIGAALALRALHEVSYLADPRRALGSSSYAIQLAGSLPSVRTVRGMVVLAGHQLEQGLQEFAAARQLRGDAPRLHNMASAELLTGELEPAVRDVQAALALAPDFAAAHATLGSLASMRGEAEEARTELALAEKLAPDLTLVQWALAELRLRDGDRDGALVLARRALDKRPSFDARVRMGVLLRQAARFDELRAQAQQVLAMSPPYRQSEVRELIGKVLGPAALDADARDPEADPDLMPTPDLQLAPPTLEPVAEPRAEELEDGGPRPYRRPEPTFRLKGANDQLRLNLSH